MKIVLGTFKDEGEELAKFLEPRLGTKVDVGGGELTVDDDSIKKTVRSRHVKTYVKRFLWKKGERRNYRVLVEGKELRLIELEPSEAEAEERKEEEERQKAQAEKKEEAPEPAQPEPKAEEPPKEEVKAETPEEPEKKPSVPKEPKKRSRKTAEKAQPSASP